MIVALLLRVILVTLAAVVVALAVPRLSGEEYYLAVRWDVGLEPEDRVFSTTEYPPVRGVFAQNDDLAVAFSRDRGDLLYSSVRHEALAISPEFFLNQSPDAGDRWVVMRRRDGARTFIDRYGVPRLFGSILVQYGAGEIVLHRPGSRAESRILHHGELTALDVATFGTDADNTNSDSSGDVSSLAGESGTTSLGVAATGDLFGYVRLVWIDPSGQTREPATIATNREEKQKRLHPVYGVKLLPGEPIRVLSVHGTVPQAIALHGADPDAHTVQWDVLQMDRIDSPPTMAELDSGRVVVGMRNAVYVVDPAEESMERIDLSDGSGLADGDPNRITRVVGVFSAGMTATSLVTFEEQSATVHLLEALKERSERVSWTFPGATVAALQEDLLVLERDSRFLGIEVLR